MKKLIIVILSMIAFAAVASAQPRAMGVRAGYGVEVSYQHYLGVEDFLEADLGLVGNHGFYLTGIYNFNIGYAGPFSFYAGPGAQAGFYRKSDKDGGMMALNLAVGGQIGAEWAIPSAPINISLDWRPMFYLMHGGFGWDGFALGFRYRF